MQEVTTYEEFSALGSAYTITGAGGDLQEWTNGYQKLLVAAGILKEGQELKWHTWKGAVMNKVFGLTGDNAYPDDLTFLAFGLENDNLAIGPLAMFKLQNGDRWLDDIISNNQYRQNGG
jgi:hypothetical protein